MKNLLKSTWVLLAAGAVLICWDLGVRAAPVVPSAEKALEAAERSARHLLASEAERRTLARKESERVRKDLRYISEELDRETLTGEQNRSLREYSLGALARLATLRLRGAIDPKLLPVLDRLEKLYRELPSRTWAKEYPASLVKAINEELRWAAEEGKTPAEMVALLKRDLVLPDRIPQDGDLEDLAFFPVDVPVQKFLKLGPIKIFLAKHRLKRPKSHVRTTAAKLIAGDHNVQIGVEVEGTVTWAGLFPWDMDYTFNIGDLHMEITPEWRLLHPNTHLPKVGDKIKVKGWTYYDYFHKSELEYDPEDPVLGLGRKVVWEIHPIQAVEVVR